MKKWLKILCFVGVFVVGLSVSLAGCATVSNITNSYEEVIYNGNSAVNVDGYLYFGNSAVDIDEITDNSTYKSYSKISYLARVNTNEDLAATSVDYSPADVGNVSTEVTAYDGNFMFVLGNYIYYATPNTQKAEDEDGEVANYFNYTCIYKSKLNGDGKKKLYTTNGEISQIEVLKADGTYYIVMLAGDDLIKINLSTGKDSVLAENVTSVAMPETYQKDVVGSSLEWNEYVYYTISVTSESGSDASYNAVYKVDLASDEASKVYSNTSTDIEFIDRIGDVAFYTETQNSTSAVYMIDLTSGSFTSNKTAFSQGSNTISDVKAIYRNVTQTESDGTTSTSATKVGYIYTVGSSLGYHNISTGKNGVISLTVDGSALSSYNILAVTESVIYLSTTTGIYSVDIAALFSSGTTSFECNEIVAMTAIYDGALCAYDGTYIYYYAQLEEVGDEDSDSDDDDEEEETDENYYLYRVKTNGIGTYQLLGLTEISSRRS